MAEKNFRVRKGLTVDGTGTSSIAGNVGIGTTSPYVALDVRDGDIGLGHLWTNGSVATPVNIGKQDSTGGWSAGSAFMTFRDSNATSVNKGTSIYFSTHEYGGSTAERVRFAADGKVGIGTATPGYLLEVDGTFHANSINVNGAYTLPTADGSANYVLKTDGSGNVSWAADASGGGGSFSVTDITGATALTTGLASTDELVLSDGGALKRMDISVIEAYMQSALTFTTDTNTTYSAGTGLDLSSTTFSVDVSDFMTNGSNNRIVTATGTDGQNAEANLTFNGSTLTVSGDVVATGTMQGYKTEIKSVSSNTTLADADSGKTVYWTSGTLTLPSTAQAGQQYVVINNTGGSATPGLGSSNAIVSGWTAHAAMDDETARTYISPATNKWLYIG